MIIYYDNGFNQNEYFVLVLLLFYFVIFLLPKRFPLLLSIIFILYGLFLGVILDQLIAIPPYDFYDVSDSGYLELFDLLLYISYGSFSYFIVYIFDMLKFKKQYVLLYIPLLSLIGLAAEWLGLKFGEFHYKNGYRLLFSYPIYLIAYSVLFILYFTLYLKKSEENKG